jgi:hypothetical protein
MADTKLLESGKGRDDIESPFEHLELSEYLRAFKESSERVRHIIFILAVLSAIIFVADWNAGDSWLQWRYRHWRSTYQEATEKLPDKTAANKIVVEAIPNIHSLDELRENLSELTKRRVERLIFFEIPALGVAIDINDLAIFSGVTFLLLFALLTFSLVRQHENLYLSLFKVRRLADADPCPSRGDSKANFLYHALVMGQVFSYPPTLARWKPGWKQHVAALMLFIPVAILWRIVHENGISLNIPNTYHKPSHLILQWSFVAALFLLAIISAIYFRSCNHRWRSAFLYVNPALTAVEPSPWHYWVRLLVVARPSPNRRRLIADLASRLTLCDTRDEKTFTVDVEEPARRPIRYRDLVQISKTIERKAFDQVKEKTGADDWDLVRCEVVKSDLTDHLWRIVTRWKVRCVRKDPTSSRHSSAPEPLAPDLPPAPLGARSLRS